MIYQLPTGRTIEISIDQYFDMSDDDIEYFIAYEVGDFNENPFFASSFYNKKIKDDDVEEDIIIELDYENEEE